LRKRRGGESSHPCEGKGGFVQKRKKGKAGPLREGKRKKKSRSSNAFPREKGGTMDKRRIDRQVLPRKGRRKALKIQS